MTLHTEDSPAGPKPHPPGRGPDAAAGTRFPATAVPGADRPVPGGTRDNQDRPGGEAHPAAPPGPESAPGRSPLAGADRGQVEPPSGAPARPVPAADVESGSRDISSQHVGSCEGTAGPGAPSPGPAQASPPAFKRQGDGDAGAGPAAPRPAAGSAETPSSGGRPGSPDDGKDAGGAARVTAAAPPVRNGMSGQDARKAWRAAESAKAKAARNQRGRYPVKRQSGTYQAGGNRRMPPPPRGAA